MSRITLVLLVLALAAACSAEAEPATPDAPADPIDLAVKKAAETGKSVLVMYGSDTCCCCKLMDDETFSEPEVEDTLGEVEYVRVTKGKDAAGFESRWPGSETPSFVVLGPDGKARGDVLRGPFDAGEFLYLLDWIVEGEGPQPDVTRMEDGCGGDEGGCGGCGGEEEKAAEEVPDDG